MSVFPNLFNKFNNTQALMYNPLFNLILAITEGGELYDIHGPQSTESGPDTQSFAAFNQSDHTEVSII